MKIISEKQQNDVTGGFGVVGAGFGAFIGGLSYLGNATTSGNFSWGGLGTSVGVGALSGAVGGPVGSSVIRYTLTKVSFYGGALQGATSK